MRIIALMFALMFASTAAVAHDFKAGDMMVMHPISYPTMGRSGAGYMMIQSTGGADRLIGVEGDFPKVMMHNTVIENDVAKMKHMMGVDIPAGGSVEFAPGGMHVMFMGVSKAWVVEDKIKATLIFEKAGRLDVVFKVEERPEGAAHSH